METEEKQAEMFWIVCGKESRKAGDDSKHSGPVIILHPKGTAGVSLQKQIKSELKPQVLISF